MRNTKKSTLVVKSAMLVGVVATLAAACGGPRQSEPTPIPQVEEDSMLTTLQAEPTVAIVIAAQYIPRGTRITADNGAVTWRVLPRDQVPDGAIYYLEDAYDRVTRVYIRRGTPIVESMLTKVYSEDEGLRPPPTRTPPPLPFNCGGKVCRINQGQDTNTIFLRQAEFSALGLPEGTKVTVTVLDTGKSRENVTLGLASDVVECTIRMSESLRTDLGLADDTDLPVENRPTRQFSIHPYELEAIEN